MRKNSHRRAARVWSLVALAVLLAMLAGQAFADSVGQKVNAKYFAPETVQLLKDRAANNTPGFQVGDTVSYIIEFQPIDNGSTTGVHGYATDYLPAGTEVVGAWIVQPDGSGGFTAVAPDLPGEAPDGWGSRGQNTYLAPFNTAVYDTSGKCAAVPFTNNCNSSIAMLYADTGIFYSTDSRTALFVLPDVDGRARQGTNGYNINPTGAANLNTLLGQAKATTHNLWDANQTNAFGSTSAAVGGLAVPKSAAGALLVTKPGQGATPFNAGSAVAGPLTGYQLDNTGSVGPWQRIAYGGSRIGSNIGPARGAGLTTITGTTTAAGFALSPANPLPANTNAVRWAVGRLVIGQPKYVKISLRLTAPPASGLLNNCEVFGGDVATTASPAKNAKDNTWRYHVPSVCTSTSNLYLLKQIIRVNGAPSNGAVIPPNAVLTYRLTYLNASAIPQTNVVLTDTLPSQTPNNPLSNLVIVSGPDISPIIPNPLNAAKHFSFQTIPALAPGAGGVVEFDVQTNGANDDIVVNDSHLKSTEDPNGVFSKVTSTVVSTPNLVIQKTALPAVVTAGQRVTYTINVTNTGSANASSIVLHDVLPTMGGACCVTAVRMNFVAGSSAFSGAIAGVVPTTVSPPTLVPYVGLNREHVTWTFTGQTLAPNAGFSVKFAVTVGDAMEASGSPYVNDARVVYNAGEANASALTTISSAPALTATTTRSGSLGNNVIVSGAKISDTVYLTGTNSSTPIAGTVQFYFCQGTVVTLPNCNTDPLTAIGSPVAVTAGTNGGLQVAQASSINGSFGSGSYCFKAVFSPAVDSPYPSVSETNQLDTGGRAECIRVDSATAVTVSSFEATSAPGMVGDGTLLGLSLAGVLALGGVALVVLRKR